MWRKLWFLLLMTGSCYCELVGDHICAVEERYLVNVTEYFVTNITTREYKWCLNVPPRCSFYTSRKINDSKIVQRNETRLVERCCPGFVEDAVSNSCVPNCTLCIHGLCSSGSCSCFSGFKGKSCEEGCQPNFWGIDCKYECNCKRGSCEPSTGICNCPAGFTGPRCDKACPLGYYGRNCTEMCNCQQTQLCDVITGLCQDLTTVVSTKMMTTTKEVRAVYFSNDDRFGNLTLRKIFNRASEKPSLQVYHNFETVTTSPSFDISSPIYSSPESTSTRFVDTPIQPSSSISNLEMTIQPRSSTRSLEMNIKPTTEIVILPTDSENTVLTYKNNGKFSLTESNINNEKENEKEIRSSLDNDYYLHSKPNEEKLKQDSFNNSIAANTEFSPSVESTIQEFGRSSNDNSRDEIFNSTSTDSMTTDDLQKLDKPQLKSEMTPFTIIKETKTFHTHNSLDIYMSDESKNKSQDYISDSDKNSFLSSVSISTALSITIIVVAVIIAISRHCLSQEDKQVSPSGVSDKNEKVATVAVVTHSIFHTPLPEPPMVKNPLFSLPSEVDSTEPMAAFETKVVCSMNFTNNNKDPREYLYDHPPSTGSYRAASIPEPPELECSPVSTISVLPSEPVYDEIPCRDIPIPAQHSYDSSSTLYMNTCGRTRL